MNEKIKKAKEALEKLIEDISIDSGCSYPALYADIRAALADFDRYHESQQDLIKGKDEYIAKLLDDNKKLKEEIKNTSAESLNFKSKNVALYSMLTACRCERDDLIEFVKVLCKMKIVDSNPKIYGLTDADIELIKKVVEKYGKER